MFGCIDPGNTPAPTVDDVKRRVAGALDYLDPAKVMLSPDCGLMTISRDARAREAQGHGRGGAGICGRECDRSELVGAGVDHGPQLGAVAHPLHLRREAALAA